MSKILIDLIYAVAVYLPQIIINFDIQQSMALNEIEKKRLVQLAKRMQRYCDLLLHQCESWLETPEYEKTNKNLFREKLFSKKKRA